jgi:hypothetical protein
LEPLFYIKFRLQPGNRCELLTQERVKSHSDNNIKKTTQRDTTSTKICTKKPRNTNHGGKNGDVQNPTVHFVVHNLMALGLARVREREKWRTFVQRWRFIRGGGSHDGEAYLRDGGSGKR